MKTTSDLESTVCMWKENFYNNLLHIVVIISFKSKINYLNTNSLKYIFFSGCVAINACT